VTDQTIGQYTASVDVGQYVSHSLTTDYGDNASGINIRGLFDAIRFLYYARPRTELVEKNVAGTITVFSPAMKYVGYGIKPSTVRITDDSAGSSITIVDDGVGNLRDTTVTVVNTGSLVGHWSFDGGYQFGANLVSSCEMSSSLYERLMVLYHIRHTSLLEKIR
jgi:hypothetical protein